MEYSMREIFIRFIVIVDLRVLFE